MAQHTHAVSRSSSLQPAPRLALPAERKRAIKRRRRRDNLSALGFLTPWIVGITCIVIGPMIASLYLSFTNYDLISPPKWTGLTNYVNMFTADPRFLKSVTVTLIYVGVSGPAILVFSLILAVFLNRGIKFLAVYRALFYIPSMLGTSVAISVLWLQVFGGQGMFNDVLGFFGIHHDSWVGDPSTALGTVITLAVWTFGSTMIIFLAGLRQIPDSYYEAARLDGANSWQRFWNVTVPSLTPVIFFNGLLVIIHSFESFTPAYVISGGNGQPADSLLMYTVYLYQRGFVNFQMGYASAMAWVLLLALAVIAGLIFWSTKYWVYYGEES